MVAVFSRPFISSIVRFTIPVTLRDEIVAPVTASIELDVGLLPLTTFSGIAVLLLIN
jgi:hypothetical protein